MGKQKKLLRWLLTWLRFCAVAGS